MSFIEYDICIIVPFVDVLGNDKAVVHVGLKGTVYMILGEGEWPALSILITLSCRDEDRSRLCSICWIQAGAYRNVGRLRGSDVVR